MSGAANRPGPSSRKQPPAQNKPKRGRNTRRRDPLLASPLLYELLDKRQLLAAWPIASDDLSFQQPDPGATQFSVPASGGLLANDYDPDTPAGSLRVHTAWSAAGGTLSWSPDGSFTFSRAAGFSGIARFFYQTSDGVRTSYPAEVNIAFNSPFSPNLLADEHASGSLYHAGAWTTRMEVSPDWSYIYRSDTVSPAPVLAVEALYGGTPVGRNLTSIKSELFRGPSLVGQATYTEGLNPLAAGSRLRFALQDDSAALLPTGRYNYTFRITVRYDNQTSRSVDYALSKSLVNRSSSSQVVGSQFGQGWWLEGLEQLHLQSGGAVWVRDNGDAFWFALQGTGYATAPGDETFSTLTRPGGGNQLVLTDKWGNTRTFQLAGGNVARLSEVKALNNVSPTWRYFYDPAGRLTTIRDEYNRAWTFQGPGEFTTSITDYRGRSSTFEYQPNEPGVVIVCRWPPPPPVAVDPKLEIERAEWRCGTTNGRLTTLTDPRGVTREPVYSSRGLVERLKHGDGSGIFISPMLAQGLPAALATNAAIHVVYDAPNGVNGNWPWVRDERGEISYFKTNEFGVITRLVDAAGYRSDSLRSNRNQLYRVIQADPDGAGGPLPRPVTELGHNYWGDEVLVRNPDDTIRSATWDAVLHRPLSLTNELGEVERFGYDAVGNLLFQQDATNRRWDYVYDQSLANPGDRHGRLLEVHSPDPDGSGPLPRLVTRYEYESTIWHRLRRQYNSDHTSAAPSFRSFTYDQSDHLATVTDERNSITQFVSDDYDRLRVITLPPDRDGYAGVIQRKYDRIGQLSEELDPLGNRTRYHYDPIRGWLNSVERYSASGTLLATERFLYFADGSLRSRQLPGQLAGAAEYYGYDGRGNLTEVTRPSGGVTTLQYDGLSRLVFSRDPSGREQTFVYDSRDRLTAARDHDPDGTGPLPAPTTSYSYDAASRLTSQTDPLGRATAYSYLANGWLQQQTLPDPDGALGPATNPLIAYAYNNLGQVTRVTAPGGRVTDLTYDNRARVASSTGPDPDGSGPLPRPATSYQYLRTGELLTATDQLGRRTDYDYDRLGRLLSVLLPDIDGNASTTGDRPLWQYRYDLAGNLVRTINPLAAETVFERDGLGRPRRMLEPDPDGNPATADQPIWVYSYGSNSLLESVTDPLLRRTSYEYDNFGRQTARLEPAADGSASPAQRSTVRYEYDSLDRVARVLSDADGFGVGNEPSSTAYTYDRYGRLAMETDALGGTTRYGYDLAGQLTSLHDPGGNETRWAYDRLGRAKFESNQLGHSRHFDYDAVGNLLRRTDRNGRLIQSTYDLLDRRTGETWHAGQATAQVLATRQGGAGASEIQALSFTGLTATNDKFQLGFAGEVTRILPSNASAAGVKAALEELVAIDNVSVTLSTSGGTRTYAISFGGSLSGQDVPLVQAAALPASSGAQQNSATYQYNAAGLLAEAGDSAARHSWQYDRLNRQTTESADLEPANPLNSLIGLSQTYDLVGNRTELAARFTDFGSGGSATQREDFRNSYSYDRLQRLSSIRQTAASGGSAANPVVSKLVTLAYNPAGQLTFLSRYEGTTNPSGPTLRTAWTYDGAGRLATLSYRSLASSSNLLNQYTFQYDQMNRLTSLSSTRDGASSFGYDATSQLKSAVHQSPRLPEAYQYDAAGNRLGSGHQLGANNQSLADQRYNYQYDAEGNRTRRTAKLTTAPEPIEDYTWDQRNRLTKITFRNGAGVETRSIEYRYDLLNRLVLRRYDSNGSATAGGVSDLWLAGYDGINPTLALSSLSSTAVTNRYLWGPGVDFLLADEQRGSSAATGNTLWPLGDHLGTLRDLADFSGASFTITNHRVFDTFGRLLSETNSSVDSNFAFTGKFFEDLGDTDPTTSLSHHWNRWYDPQLGKWLSEDPIGFAGGDANLGRYVGNFATGAVDWNGLFSDGFLDWIQGGLDVGGTFEPTPFCDIANTAICIGRGRWSDAGLTIAGVFPYFGDAGKAVKHGKKLVERAAEVTNAVTDLSKASDLSKGAKVGQEVLDQTVRQAGDLVRATDGLIKGADEVIKGADEVIQATKEATKAADDAIRKADELLEAVDSGGDSTKLLDELLAPVRTVPGKSLLPGEGAVGTYDDLIAAGTKGDNITPHHIPSANHMKQHGVSKGDGISINMEQPHPGTGGRHRSTFTYGSKADVNLSPRDALGRGVRDTRRSYQEDGLYTVEIRKALQELIRQNKAANKGLFDK